MAAVHVENRPAALALEQEARVLVRVAAVLVAGALIRHELVDKPLAAELFELAVHRGQANGLPLPVQLLRQLRRRRAAAAEALDAGEHRLLLARHIGHGCHSSEFEIEIHFQIIADFRNLSSKKIARCRRMW